MAPQAPPVGGGLVFYSVDSEDVTFLCAVCRQGTCSLADLKNHARSHDLRNSSISLPITPSWIRAAPKPKKEQTLTLEIPFNDFTKVFLKKGSLIQKVKPTEIGNQIEEQSPEGSTAGGDTSQVAAPEGSTAGGDTSRVAALSEQQDDDTCTKPDIQYPEVESCLGQGSPDLAESPTTRTSSRLKDKTRVTWGSGRKKVKGEGKGTETEEGKQEALTTDKKVPDRKRKKSKDSDAAEILAKESSPVRKKGKRSSVHRETTQIKSELLVDDPLEQEEKPDVSTQVTSIDAYRKKCGEGDLTYGEADRCLVEGHDLKGQKDGVTNISLTEGHDPRGQKQDDTDTSLTEGHDLRRQNEGEADTSLAQGHELRGQNEGEADTSLAKGQKDDDADTSLTQGRDLRGRKEGRKYWVKDITEFQCKDCQWKSPHHFNYHRHMFTHRKNLGQFVCDYCNKPLDTVGGKSGYGQKKGTCDICGAGPMFQGRLTTHMVSEHNISSSPISGKPILSCHHCLYKTSKPSLLAKHLLRHDQEGTDLTETKPQQKKRNTASKVVKISTLICDQCGYTTKRSDLLKSHMIRHNPEAAEELQCDHCDFVTMSSKGLLIHKKSHQAFLQCSECPVDRDGPPNQHMPDAYPTHLLEVHSLPSPVFCKVCGQVVPSSRSLEEHVAEKHPVTPKETFYVCYECGDAMGSKEDLMNHQAQHGLAIKTESAGTEGDAAASPGEELPEESEAAETEGDQPDTGEQRTSGKGYRTLRQRLSTLRTASHVKEFSCSRCAESFPSLTDMNLHLHHGHAVTNFRFQCKTCGSLEANQGRLRKHVSQHHCVREVYVCDLCGFEAARRWNLMRHKESAHQFTTYSCSHCDYSTKSVIRIADHFKKVHLTEPPSDIQRLTEEASKDKGAGLNHFVKEKRKAYTKKMMKTKYAPEKKMCSDCGKLIPAGLMEMHMNAHLGLKPYRCHYDNCSYSAVASSMIAEHIRRKHLGIQSKKYRYQCAYCDFQHQNRKFLERHITMDHPKVEETEVDVPAAEPLFLKQETDEEALEGLVTVGDEVTAEEVHIEVSTDVQPGMTSQFDQGTEMYMMIAPEMEDPNTGEAVVEGGFITNEVHQFSYDGSEVITPELLDGSTQHIVVICEDQMDTNPS